MKFRDRFLHCRRLQVLFLWQPSTCLQTTKHLGENNWFLFLHRICLVPCFCGKHVDQSASIRYAQMSCRQTGQKSAENNSLWVQKIGKTPTGPQHARFPTCFRSSSEQVGGSFIARSLHSSIRSPTWISKSCCRCVMSGTKSLCSHESCWCVCRSTTFKQSHLVESPPKGAQSSARSHWRCSQAHFLGDQQGQIETLGFSKASSLRDLCLNSVF